MVGVAKDFLDEIVKEATAKNPRFLVLVEAARARRAQMRKLAAVRASLGLSQTQVAARMGTSQSVVARLESGEVDTKESTLAKYAEAMGKRLEISLR
jgi:ribosome-binding protein aMBF1 (putative translation factor)